MNWFKERVGLQDPVYGPSAIQPVNKQAGNVPYSEVTKDDLIWQPPSANHVATQVFYVTADSGHFLLISLIYSNLGVLGTTTQFSSKLFHPNNEKPSQWASDNLSNWGFDEKKYSFHADKCSITLSEAGDSFRIKSSTSAKAVIDFTISRVAPGFQAGKNGTSYYGTDPKKPWGSMMHRFWPRCQVEGSFISPKEGEISMKGRGIFIHALQGMRPNLAAATWNFLNFQSPTYSAIMMEFTTPPSYGSTVVNVGCIAVDGKILLGGGTTSVEHTSTKKDPEMGWPQPESAKFLWHGPSSDGGLIQAEISGQVGPRVDRVDVLAEIPGFLKAIIATAAGTKPYIYQYLRQLPLKIQVDGQDKEEQGFGFMEATFITGDSTLTS